MTTPNLASDPNAAPATPPTRPQPKQRITPRALLDVKRPSDPKIHPDGQRVAFVLTEADWDDSRMVSHLWLTESLHSELLEEAGASEEANAAPSPLTQDHMAPPGASDDAGESDDSSAAETAEPDDPTRQLTFSDEGEASPQWSPDGRWLAFLSSRPDLTEPEPDEDEPVTDQVWILPIDGGEARKLSSAREGVLDYAWLPDSSGLLYLAPEPRPKPIESVRKDERGRRKVDPIVEGEDKLRRQFWRVNVEAPKPRLLLTGDYGVSEFAVSPDGERIAWLTNYTGEENDYHLADLFVVGLNEGEPFKLVERKGGKYHLRWSPDSRQIAFLSWLDPALSYSRETLFVAAVPASVPAESHAESGSGPADAAAETGANAPNSQERTRAEVSNLKAVSTAIVATEAAFDWDVTSFDWSQHDGFLYLIAAARTASEMYRVLPGATLEKLRLEPGLLCHDISADQAGEGLTWVQESFTALPEVVLRDMEGVVRPLTRLNADFADTYVLPYQEVVSWTSPDGMMVEGVLTLPAGDGEAQDEAKGAAEPQLLNGDSAAPKPKFKKPNPLVVQIHGGPKGRATQSLRGYTLPAVWAAEGYAVLQPNFRGSEGYGAAFAVANRRDLGGGDFADIMAGVDWCIAQGLADPDRLGVMGGSYGGFMTNWAIGHTDRFRGAVSMFGIFHLQTDYSNSELSRWDNDYLGAYPWEDPEIYRRLSPGSYVEAIKTPTLILHGDDDSNTFIANSKELFQALRHRGVTTQFVHYPREGHGLREPNHRLDETRRSLAWMDRYVRHGGAKPEIYRVGDRIPSADDERELLVSKVEVGSYLGLPKATPLNPGDPAPVLLEVIFTLHNVDVRHPAAPLALALSDVRLESSETGASVAGASEATHALAHTTLVPIGVPLEVPGGKVLIEGDNLRVSQAADSDTAQFAFGLGVVFRVPPACDTFVLRVLDFPPVAIAWSAEEDSEPDESPATTDPS